MARGPVNAVRSRGGRRSGFDTSGTLIEGSEEEIRVFVTKALKDGREPAAVLDQLSDSMEQVGAMFERGEAFLPELMLAADAMQAAVDVLTPALAASQGAIVSKGTIVIGTVKDDVHDVGENIVASLLTASGFTVHDVYGDVYPPETFVRKAQEVHADIIAVSTLLSTTMDRAEHVIAAMDQADLPLCRCIISGAPVTEQWAQSIGAYGTAKDAPSAVALCERLDRDGTAGRSGSRTVPEPD